MSAFVPSAFLGALGKSASAVPQHATQAPLINQAALAQHANTNPALVVAVACAGSCAMRMRSDQAQGLYRGVTRKAFENELGVQAPVGFWDPAGLSMDGDLATFKRRRETEIKHGRVAMLACIGYIVPEFVRFPGDVSAQKSILFTSIPNGLKALAEVPAVGWIQIFLFCGLMDTAWIPYDDTRGPGDRARCGELGVPNGSSMKDGEIRTRKLNAELANGRLAMMASIGMFFQDGLTGSAWGDWAEYVGSPLRGGGSLGAFDVTKELGAQAPVGYWDPANLCETEEQWWKFRSAEIKHGRVAMLAVIGFLFPSYSFAFPDFVGTKASWNLTGPVAGGFGIVVLMCGFLELKVLKQKEGSFPGDFGDPWGGARMFNNEVTAEMRQRELAHCRLAMSAVITWALIEYLTDATPVEQVTGALKFDWFSKENIPKIALFGTVWASVERTTRVNPSSPKVLTD